VGVAMVMINFHIELCVESYALDIGTGWRNIREAENLGTSK
jgi:hypothetical protein